jgi:hypothetical protein
MSTTFHTTNAVGTLIAAIAAWVIGGVTTSAYAQGCCGGGQHGSSGYGAAAGHSMGMGMPAMLSVHQMGGGGHSMCAGGGCTSSGQEEEQVATDLIKWPTLLKKHAFAARRQRIEAPFRRSPPKISTPTADDYQNMVKATDEMKAIVEWFATKGIDTREYEEANRFLDKLGEEAGRRFELASKAAPARAPLEAETKRNPPVLLVATTVDDRAGIARQKVCPVTKAKLGEMGDPIKVVIDGKPLYLCCRGCAAKVQGHPEEYLPKPSSLHASN